MPATVVVDSGPLDALFDKDDRFHADALRFIQRLKGRAVYRNRQLFRNQFFDEV